MKKRKLPPKPEPRTWGRTILATLVSLLLHIAVVGGVWRLARDWQPPAREAKLEPIRIQFRSAQDLAAAEKAAEAAKHSALPQPKPDPAKAQQIVDLKQREAEPIKPTDLLAAQNARADKEMIARSTGRTQNQAANSEPPPPNQPSQASVGDGGDAGTVEDQARVGRGQSAPPTATRRSGKPGSAQALVPQMSDLLAGDYSAQDNYIQRNEGPVTLLNAKSSPFAGYLVDSGHAVVRYLNINGSLMSWYFQDVQNLKLPLEARMRIGRSGEVTQSGLTHSSGSVKVDQWFLDALRSGFTGKQPPKEIFRDGAEEFVVVGMFHLDHISVGIP